MTAFRVCQGANHAEGCLHEAYMAQGVERFLAHPRVHRMLVLALSQVPAPRDPHAWANTILVEMAKAAPYLDRLDVCETPQVETSLERPSDGDLAGLDVWFAHAVGAERIG